MPTWKTICANVSALRCICVIAQGKGALEITFFSDDELERSCEILGVKPIESWVIGNSTFCKTDAVFARSLN